MSKTANTKSQVKTKPAVTASAVIDRYDAIDTLAIEERRFYVDVVRRLQLGTATDGDKRAVKS